jgi:hypothetical protein
VSVSLWYAIANGSGSCTVTATASGSCDVSVGVVEYSGVSQSSPLDGHNSAGGFPTPGDMSTGTVPVNGSGELLFGCFGQTAVTQEASPDSGFTRRPAFVTNESLTMEDQLGVGASQAATATNNSRNSSAYGAIGASFKPAG